MRLDNIDHADLKVAPGFGAAYGDAVNQMQVFLPEFGEAQRDYPILFHRLDDGSLQAVAILGLDQDENLFLDNGHWLAGYIPALARKGPFLIGFVEGEPVIHVDLDHPRVARDGAPGEPLFLPHGGQAQALERGLDALRILHLGSEAAPSMALFDELGLVEPVTLEIEVAEGHSFEFADYLVIQLSTISALDGAALARLNEADLLMPAVFAAGSLSNMERLAARKRARLG